jgi:hypothetical protein
MYTVTIDWIKAEAKRNHDLGENIKLKEFATIDEIKRFIYSLHDRYDWLGGSNWNKKKSKVYKESNLIGLISYNGRVWADENCNNEVLDSH